MLIKAESDSGRVPLLDGRHEERVCKLCQQLLSEYIMWLTVTPEFLLLFMLKNW